MTEISGSAHIRVRQTKSGRRYIVRFRMGGHAFPPIHAGSFKLRRHAKARLDFILGELAAGRDPRDSLATLSAPKERVLTLYERFDQFSASRIDVSASTTNLYRNARDRLGSLADADPATLTPGRIQSWIGELSDLSRGTIEHYLNSLRQVLDFCDLEPNPARSKKIRLPREVVEEVSPPSCAEWHALRACLMRRSSLPLRLIECTGIRIGEATALRWGDVDFAAGRIRISKARTKGRTAGQRWLPVPDALLEQIGERRALEDRDPERPVFDVTASVLRDDMARACRDAQIAHYHPHELRHLRCSLLLLHGIDAISLKVWSGHSKASMLQDVYGHVVLDPRQDEWREFWLDVYAQERGERLGRGAPVGHREGETE